MLNFDTKVIFRNIDAEIEKQIEELEQQAQQCYYNNDYPQTLEYLDKILNLLPKDDKRYYFQINKGLVLFDLGYNEEAIAIYNLIPPHTTYYNIAQYNKGNFLFDLKLYEKAIECYMKLQDRDTMYYSAQYNMGISFLYLDTEKYKDAAHAFIQSKKDILDIWSDFQFHPDIKKVIEEMLDADSFFQEVIKKDTKGKTKGRIKEYKALYMKVLELVITLQVNQDQETAFAHYTRRSIVEKLLFDKTHLRLSATITSNDPKEGEVLKQVLKEVYPYQTENNTGISSDYAAFISCFTFNHNSLNQFRLYGKEHGEEGTGVSVVVNKEFFSQKLTSPVTSIDNEKKIDRKPLFRCMYLDPISRRVISIGHKDKYAFLIEDKNAEQKVINSYLNEISKITNDVDRKLTKLKNFIKKNKPDYQLVCELLLPLRYLIKHAAFKDEQECRLLDIQKITSAEKDNPVKYKDEKIAGGDYQMLYVEYDVPVWDYIEKVYFGPRASQFPLFQKMLLRHGLKDVECEICNHPFQV